MNTHNTLFILAVLVLALVGILYRSMRGCCVGERDPRSTYTGGLSVAHKALVLVGGVAATAAVVTVMA